MWIFINPGLRVLMLRRGSYDYIVKMHLSFESILLFSWLLSRWIKNMYIVTMRKIAKNSEIVKLMAPESSVLVLGWGLYECSNSLKIISSAPRY